MYLLAVICEAWEATVTQTTASQLVSSQSVFCTEQTVILLKLQSGHFASLFSTGQGLSFHSEYNLNFFSWLTLLITVWPANTSFTSPLSPRLTGSTTTTLTSCITQRSSDDPASGLPVYSFLCLECSAANDMDRSLTFFKDSFKKVSVRPSTTLSKITAHSCYSQHLLKSF